MSENPTCAYCCKPSTLSLPVTVDETIDLCSMRCEKYLERLCEFCGRFAMAVVRTGPGKSVRVCSPGCHEFLRVHCVGCLSRIEGAPIHVMETRGCVGQPGMRGPFCATCADIPPPDPLQFTYTT